jgi:hypothetical protein
MGVSADSCKGVGMGAVSLVLLGPDGQAVAVPIEDLDAIAPLVDEDEEMTGEGIQRQAGDQGEEPVEALAHVRRLGREIDADGGAQSEHGGSSTTAMRRRRVRVSNPGATAMRRPLGRMSSRWAGGSVIAGAGSGRMVTGRKWWSAGAAGRSSLEADGDGWGW